MATSFEREVVEMLIRRAGVKTLLQTAAEICQEEAERVRWENKPLARKWDARTKALLRCSGSAAFVE